MIIGIDEVGRGCWAGPLVAAAVGLDSNVDIVGINDSKKLTAKKRRQLVRDIQEKTKDIGIGWVWPKEINQIGLTESVRLAMLRATQQLDFHGHHIIIDGNIDYLRDVLFKESPCIKECSCKSEAIIKADGSVTAVSAASIIAKVARDAYMAQIAEKYPQYGFENHVGYGTKQHIEALRVHGVLPIHRTSYRPIKNLLIINQ